MCPVSSGATPVQAGASTPAGPQGLVSPGLRRGSPGHPGSRHWWGRHKSNSELGISKGGWRDSSGNQIPGRVPAQSWGPYSEQTAVVGGGPFSEKGADGALGGAQCPAPPPSPPGGSPGVGAEGDRGRAASGLPGPARGRGAEGQWEQGRAGRREPDRQPVTRTRQGCNAVNLDAGHGQPPPAEDTGCLGPAPEKPEAWWRVPGSRGAALLGSQTPQYTHFSPMPSRAQSELPDPRVTSFGTECGILPPLLITIPGNSPGVCPWTGTGQLTAVGVSSGQAASGLGSVAIGHVPEAFLNRSTWGSPARTSLVGQPRCPRDPGHQVTKL